MMSYANLVLLVIMAWTGFFTLVNSDQLGCNKYNIPKTAVWVPRDTCEVSKSNPCNAGYQLQIQTTCNDNGKWDVEPSCQVKDCGNPPQGYFSTGTATSGTTYPNVADYTCDVGHEIVSGNEQISCLASGQWSDDNGLVCRVKDCGNPPQGYFSTGTATSGTTYPNVADYTCDVGHEIVSGNEQISCLASGQWDVDNILVCDAKDCGDVPPGNFSTGTATSGTTYPNVADYTCDVGHEIVSGNVQISCLASGKWSDDNGLVCRAKDCGNPPLANTFSTVTAKSGTTYPNVATYTCDQGYDIGGGKEEISCLASGKWDGDILFCEDLSYDFEMEGQ